MTRVFNFSAGPAVLPESVLHQAADEMLDWHGSGMSVMEMSHRGKEFISIHAEAEALLRELMAIPANYKVLFLQGGAIGENAIVPLNLLGSKTSADYINTGEWSKKSMQEAKRYCQVHEAASDAARRRPSHWPGSNTRRRQRRWPAPRHSIAQVTVVLPHMNPGAQPPRHNSYAFRLTRRATPCRRCPPKSGAPPP